MSFTILEELWFGDIDDTEAKKKASTSLAASTARLHGLRPFPASAQRLLSMTATADFAVDEVVTVIESDPALATRLLRIVNSAASGLAQPCKTVHGAVTLLGQRNLRQAALSAAVLMTFTRDDHRGAILLQHSFHVAAIGRELARTTGVSPEDAYTCGLLHDVGKLMLLHARDADYAPLFDEYIKQPDAIHVQEREKYGFDHGVLAGQMLSDWKIPEPLPQVVGWHHDLQKASQKPSIAKLIHLIHLADRLSLVLDQDPEEQFFDQLAESYDATALSLSSALLQGMWGRLRNAANPNGEQVPEESLPPASARSESSDDEPIPMESVPPSSKMPALRSLQATRPSSAVPRDDQLCVVCGKQSFGTSCGRCHGMLCSEHDLRERAWCAKCQKEFDEQTAGATSERAALYAIVALGAVGLVLTVLIAVGVRAIPPIATVVAMGAFVLAVAWYAWGRWARRSKFLRGPTSTET